MTTNRLAQIAGYGQDFAQGASNAIASNVSAPVDGLAWLMRRAGLPVNNPFFGSNWMAEQGLTAEPKNKLAGLLGESAGGLLPILATAKSPQIAGGLLGMYDNATAPTQLNKQAGMALFDTNGLQNRGRELIQQNAETLAEKLRALNFKVDVTHSGSAAGPSSYLRVFDPSTGRFFDDVRLSGHSKGVFNSTSVNNVATPEEFAGVVDRAIGMRNLGPAKSYFASENTNQLARIASEARPKTFNAFKDARDSGAEFTKYRAK